MHMPPWTNFDAKMPILCNELRIRIELSGLTREKTPYVLESTTYCILFKNVLVFCQATVAKNAIAPQAPSDTVLGFVFLQNLGTQALSQKSFQKNRRTSSGSLSFVLNLGISNSLIFILPFHAVSLSQRWYDSLQACLLLGSGAQGYDDPTFIQVIFSKMYIADYGDSLQYTGGRWSFSNFVAKLNDDKAMYSFLKVH